MSKAFKDENTVLLNNFFERTFFRAWKMPAGEEKYLDPFKNLEIFLTSDCNLGCTYCYLNRHEDELFAKDIREEENILKNLKMLLNWLHENGYQPEIELFTGAGLESELGLRALELMADHYGNLPEDKRITFILLPTNFTFLLKDELVERVDRITKSLNDLGIQTAYSASIDGLHMEKNRPFRSKKRVTFDAVMPEGNEDPRDEEFYDKVFKFIKKHNGGFHPMVYANRIEHWKKNFLWFQEKFDEHDIPFNWIYLLEVRNEEWNDEQLDHYADFLEFLIEWSFDRFDRDPEKYSRFITRDGFNMLKSPFGGRARGTTCSLQTTMFVRMGDLEIVPCHRQSYDGYSFGNFTVEDDKITGIEAKNVSLAIAMTTFDVSTQPYCETCVLRDICVGGCMGSQLEANGDPFIPIPTVCNLFHLKYYTVSNKLRELGIYNEYIVPAISNQVVQVHENLRKLVEEGSNE